MGTIVPDRARFIELSKNSNVIPVYREMLADHFTPVLAKRALGHSPGAFLLESVVGGERWGRYSFVGHRPRYIVRGVGDRFEIVRDNEIIREDGVDVWERLREEVRSAQPAELPELPRFWGGFVGYLAYDAVRLFEECGLKPSSRDDDWLFQYGVGATTLIFDNLSQTLRVVAPAFINGRDPDEAYDEARASIDETLKLLSGAMTPRLDDAPLRTREGAPPRSNMSREEFERSIAGAVDYIRAGEAEQIVLSQRFVAPREDVELFDIYRVMRAINPSPYMFFVDFDGLTLAGASPETMVRLEGGVVNVRPIAGTRHRGATPEEDAAIERELMSDEKELIEHRMLIDLGMEEISSVSKPGTARVSEEMIVERYSHVMHIVSNVQGDLADDKDALDVIRATFPAGTLTGAPRRRAIQIIDELESAPRGVYGGAVGYIGFGGKSTDAAIAIRTVVANDDELWLQAGAGVVELSDPAKEWQETVNKASAGFIAIEGGKRLSKERS